MRIRDWSSDVCSSDLTDDDGDACSVSGRADGDGFEVSGPKGLVMAPGHLMTSNGTWSESICRQSEIIDATGGTVVELVAIPGGVAETGLDSPGTDGSESSRSEEQTAELPSLMTHQ